MVPETSWKMVSVVGVAEEDVAGRGVATTMAEVIHCQNKLTHSWSTKSNGWSVYFSMELSS